MQQRNAEGRVRVLQNNVGDNSRTPSDHAKYKESGSRSEIQKSADSTFWRKDHIYFPIAGLNNT